MRPLTLPTATACVLLVALMDARCACAGEGSDPLQPRHGTVTYVDFWASWCTPCAQSFTWLNQMQAKYAAQGLRIVGVGVDESAPKGDRFLQQHPAQFEIVRDPEGKLAERLGVEGMPYAVLLDGDGKVVHRHTGFRDGDAGDYESAIRAALAAKGATK